MQRYKPFLFPEGARPGEHNLVLHASARRHSVHDYAGPLSIKTVLNGRVSWMLGGRELVVDPTSFLVLAAGERYSMNIDEPEPVETCCAFFSPGYLERVALDLTSGPAAALESPASVAPSLPYLSAMHSDLERSLATRVSMLAAQCEGALNPSGTEECFLLLAASLLRYYQEIRAQQNRVPAMRLSTREELFRRLLIGRDFIHSNSSRSVSLAEAADAACLSLFHFHRGFTQTFRETPHSYLTSLRLTQARDMMEKGASVLESCVAVGFSSPSAFSRLFRARIGIAPSQIRRKFARSGK